MENNQFRQYEDICIIGGGAAGSYAAYLLQDQNPLLITEEKELGGKCISANVKGYQHDLGAIQVTHFYKHARAMAKVIGLNMTPFPAINFSDGNALIQKIVAEHGYFKFIKDIVKYVLYAWFYRKLIFFPSRVERYPQAQQSVEDYIKAKQITSLRPVFEIILTSFGYGKLSDLPIYSGFAVLPYQNVLTSLLFMPFKKITFNKMIKEGYQALVQGMVRVANTRVQTERKVTSIDLREKSETGYIKLMFADNSHLYVKKVILCAVPEKIAIVYPDFDRVDQEFIDTLKDKIKTSPYISVLFETVKPLPYDCFVELQPKDLYPVLTGRKFPDQNLYITYLYGTRQDEGVIEQNVKQYFFEKFSVDHIKLHTIKMFENYYPHPSYEAVTGGFYSKMEGLQGKYGLYFAGSWLSFEMVERAMENAAQVVKLIKANKHF